ncbi:MAG: hypothetical protein ACREU3_05445 [Steroidobacteraceae bacterium]
MVQAVTEGKMTVREAEQIIKLKRESQSIRRRITPERRAALLSDLRLRERLTDKVLTEKYGISRATLWRVADEERTKQHASDSRGNVR